MVGSEEPDSISRASVLNILAMSEAILDHTSLSTLLVSHYTGQMRPCVGLQCHDSQI